MLTNRFNIFSQLFNVSFCQNRWNTKYSNCFWRNHSKTKPGICTSEIVFVNFHRVPLQFNFKMDLGQIDQGILGFSWKNFAKQSKGFVRLNLLRKFPHDSTPFLIRTLCFVSKLNNLNILLPYEHENDFHHFFFDHQSSSLVSRSRLMWTSWSWIPSSLRLTCPVLSFQSWEIAVVGRQPVCDVWSRGLGWLGFKEWVFGSDLLAGGRTSEMTTETSMV